MKKKPEVADDAFSELESIIGAKPEVKKNGCKSLAELAPVIEELARIVPTLDIPYAAKVNPQWLLDIVKRKAILHLHPSYQKVRQLCATLINNDVMNFAVDKPVNIKDAMSELAGLTLTMDIPFYKRTNPRWLIDNIDERNAEHPSLERVKELSMLLIDNGITVFRFDE